MRATRYYCFKQASVSGLALLLLLLNGSTGFAAVITRNVLYATVSKQELQLDVFKPEVTTGTCPVVLMLHPGGWIHGDKTSQDHFGVDLANAGIIAVGVNYRLAPAFMYPKQLNDAQGALKWVRRNIGQYGGDPSRIGILGESAGAQLGALTGLLDNRGKKKSGRLPPVRAVVNMLGPTDLVAWWNFEPSRSYLQTYLGGDPVGRAKQYRQASPINLVDANAPSFLNVYATADTLVPLSQGTAFHQALVQAGVDSSLVLLQGADHYWPPEAPYTNQESQAMLAFFRTRFGL